MSRPRQHRHACFRTSVNDVNLFGYCTTRRTRNGSFLSWRGDGRSTSMLGTGKTVSIRLSHVLLLQLPWSSLVRLRPSIRWVLSTRRRAFCVCANFKFTNWALRPDRPSSYLQKSSGSSLMSRSPNSRSIGAWLSALTKGCRALRSEMHIMLPQLPRQLRNLLVDERGVALQSWMWSVKLHF